MKHKSWSPKAQESELCCLRVRIYGLSSSKRKRDLTLLHFLYSTQATNRLGWCPPTFVWVACLLNQMLISSRNNLPKTLRNDVLLQLSGNPLLAQSSWHITSPITLSEAWMTFPWLTGMCGSMETKGRENPRVFPLGQCKVTGISSREKSQEVLPNYYLQCI